MSWTPGAFNSGPSLHPTQVPSPPGLTLEPSPSTYSPSAFIPPPVLQQRQQYPEQKLPHKALAFTADTLQKDGGLSPVFNATRLRAVNVSSQRPC